MTDDIEKRVIELEIKLTHQDRLLEELNEVVIEQRASIDKLEKRADALEKALFALQEDPANERPPHY
ncbi:MAG TPA: SlyX family protein [Polyangiaceae bacterium]|nr:SlyX family protein [Polyangiaceae bacterium]